MAVTSRGTFPAQLLRERRAWIRARWNEVDTLAQELSSGAAVDDARSVMARVVSVLDDELRPYLEWEGRMLHPIIDKFACEGPTAFSASMRYEHAVVERWIGELATRARLTHLDVRAFARRTDQLLGLLAAHLEVEDEVLLPVLDRALPPGNEPVLPAR